MLQTARTATAALACLMLAFLGQLAPTHAQERAEVLESIAVDIETLKQEFPQLADFSVSRSFRSEPPGIGYAFRTHAPARTGGWTSGVPSPHPDGVWFHIDLHDPDSQLQLHTQPVTASLCLGESRVSFLLLDGVETRSLYGVLWNVLRKHGVRECATD